MPELEEGKPSSLNRMKIHVDGEYVSISGLFDMDGLKDLADKLEAIKLLVDTPPTKDEEHGQH